MLTTCETLSCSPNIRNRFISNGLKGGKDRQAFTVNKLSRFTTSQHLKLFEQQLEDKYLTGNAAIARLSLESTSKLSAIYKRINDSTNILIKDLDEMQETLFINELDKFLSFNEDNATGKLIELKKRLDFIESLAFIRNSGSLPELLYLLKNHDNIYLQEALSVTIELINQGKVKEGRKYLHCRVVADSAAKTFEDSSDFRKRVISFLERLDREKDLPHAIFFITNLIKLNNINNADGSEVKGVKRIFNNAEEILLQEKYVAGFYFEAELALSLIEAGFKVEEVSISKITNDEGETKDLRDRNGYPREIDMIIEKEIDGEIYKFIIEAKTGFRKNMMPAYNNRLHYQLISLIEFANERDAIPVMIVRDKEPVLSEAGELIYFKSNEPSSRTKEQCEHSLAYYHQLLIWKVPPKGFSSTEELNFISSKESAKQMAA